MVRACALLACVLHAQPARVGGTGFLLKLVDPGGILTENPVALIEGSEHPQIINDDGKLPDAVAGDGVYSGPLSSAVDGPLGLQIQQGDRSWRTEIEVDRSSSEPLVMLQLDAQGQLVDWERGPPGASPRMAGNPEKSTGFLLKVHDPGGLLVDAATVVLSAEGSARSEGTINDLGKMPDSRAGDGYFSGPVFISTVGPLHVAIQQDEQRWETTVEVGADDAEPEINLRLEADGQLRETEAEERLRRPEERQAVIADASGQVILTSSTHGTQGLWLWMVLFSAAGAGAGIAAQRLGRRPGASCRLGSAAQEAIPPRRLAPGDALLALRGPLARYRVVLLGTLEEECENVIPCLETAPLPRELLRAVEALAVQEGPPVALLLSAADLLDASGLGDPLEALVAEVGGRFPLWGAGGPPHWERWSPSPGAPPGS